MLRIKLIVEINPEALLRNPPPFFTALTLDLRKFHFLFPPKGEVEPIQLVVMRLNTYKRLKDLFQRFQ